MTHLDMTGYSLAPLQFSTAGEVAENAKRVLAFRQKSWTLPPVIPSQNAVAVSSPPTSPLAPFQPIAVDAPILAIADHVAGKFGISRQTMLEGGADRIASGALLATCALVVRRFGVDRATVIQQFGISDFSLRKGLMWIDQIYASNTFSKFSTLQTVIDAIYKDWQECTPAKRISIRDIQLEVCEVFEVHLIDLVSARRTQILVRPRQVAMWIAKTLTLKSLPEIGRQFGNRDHTTALSAIRKIERLRVADIVLQSTINRIVGNLTQAVVA